MTLEGWALIRRLAAEVVPKVAIARRRRMSRTTVVKAFRVAGPAELRAEASADVLHAVRGEGA